MGFDTEMIYNTQDVQSENGLYIFFVSAGKQRIIKTVEYTRIGKYLSKEAYNLGFGDYDIYLNTIDDSINSNNNDGRMVLNTVLSTIPIFFSYYPDSVLFVRGSDSLPGFKEKCRILCKKKCGENCKKVNQRIRIYQSYVDLNFERLNESYQFFGEYQSINAELVKEEYIPGKEYVAVLLFQRK